MTNKRRAIIICSREPVAGATKTRMMPYYTGEQCRILHTCFLRDVSAECSKVDADIFVYYTREGMSGGEPAGDCPTLYTCFGQEAVYRMQVGENIFVRMDNAFKDVLGEGYDSAVLIGADIPELNKASFEYAFETLENCDVVLGPSTDGGYHLIGMKQAYSEPFDVDPTAMDCLAEAIKAIDKTDLTYQLVEEHQDMDNREDIADYRSRMRQSEALRNTETGKFVRDNTTVSIVIPVLNEEASIVELQLQLSRYADEAEIIFVDGGSTDRTLELISPRYKVINSNRGRGAQLNAGAEASTGDVVFFLHCDSKLPEDFLGQIRECMARAEYGCFGVRFESKNLFMFTNRIISNHRAKRRGIPFGDQGIFIDRKLFLEMGMFPEYPIMEDYEFSLRLKRQGYMPAMTRERITTSDRRYGDSTADILRTEYKMWKLRRQYERGVSLETIKQQYKDIR